MGEEGDDSHYRGHRRRLRARFREAGPKALADYEVLELLLFAAIPRRDVKPLAKQLIDRFGSLGAVLAADPRRLERDGGLTEPVAVHLSAVAEASRRMLREKAAEKPVIGGWHQLLDYLTVAMKYETAEQVRLLFLDRKNRLIADEVAQRGTVDHAPIYPREVAKRALELSASALVLVHNHPSGDPTPSRADVDMTRDLVKALGVVGITVHDHVIIARRGYTSFKTEGLL
ncbi:MAG: DNA repair protein RadC [Azospirillaceae bacterium]